MKPRLVPLALVTVLLLAFGTVAAACGGGGGKELTLQEYFQRLETLSVAFDERGTELQGQFDFESATSEEETIKLAQGFFREGASVLREFVNDLEDLNPPAEVEDAHNGAVEAGKGAVAAFDDLVDRVGDAESAADLGAVFEEFSTSGGPFDQFSQACSTLQGIAGDNGITVDLKCGE